MGYKLYQFNETTTIRCVELSQCEDDIVDPPPCDPTDEIKYVDQCKLILLGNGPFKECHPHIPPQIYFDSCVYDLCATGGNQDQYCNALEAYAAACENAGISVGDWSENTICYISTTTTTTMTTPTPTVPGKVCGICGNYNGKPNDDNLNPDGGKETDSKNEEFWRGDCEGRCICQGNNHVTCTTQICAPDEVCKVQNGIMNCFPADTSICHIYGDPHYITFDGKLYHFQGACNYTAVETCGNTSVYFSITTRNEHRGSPTWTAINSVAVSFNGLTIILGKNKVVEINGFVTSLPVTPAPGISISISGAFAVLKTNFGLEVKFNGDHELFVKVNENFKGKLCGLCGTYNGNQNDDFLTPEGILAPTSNDFGNSWRAPDVGWVCEDDIVDPPPCDPTDEIKYVDQCKLILLGNGPFKECHPHIPPQIYFDTCVYDLCATGGNQDQYCNALEAYAAACENAGISVGDWSENTVCHISTTTTTPTPTVPDKCRFDCSFDEGFCNWKQSVSDNIDWTRWSGPTPSSYTGPSYDHTTGNGYYLFINGQSSNEGDFARLESPAKCFSGPHCLRFWYHMYGVAQNMELKVALLTEDGLEYVSYLKGNHGDIWHLEEIFLPNTDIVQIFIDGVRGEDYRSDVAIDDISVIPGYCTGTTTTTTTTIKSTTTTTIKSTTTPTIPIGTSSTTTSTTTTLKPPTPAPPASGSCEVNGDPHYYTFDNQVHHFMGTCTYTLSKLCEVDGHLAEFNVEAANEHRGGNTRVSYVKYVNIDVHGYRITLEKNKEVKVDGNVVILPATLKPDVNIFLSGHDVVVTTAFGVSVRFDGNHRVVVTIPGEYANKVCGICGNFNRNKTDDFLNPDGELEPDSNSLGNSWQVDNDTRCTPGEVLPPACTDDEKDIITSNSFCGIITNKDGPFKNCHGVIDPSVYFNNCVYDLCELNLDPGVLCDSLQSYAQSCQAHGVTIGPWRNDSFCPLKCPPNSHYAQCGTACPATCVKPGSPSNCNLPCTEGCACDQGYVLYDKKCVPSSQCGCWEEDKHHNVGSEFWTDDTCSTKCRCPSAGGSLECKPDACPPGKYCGIKDGVPDCYDLTFGNCVIYGDPHYNTFDKETHHFMGICTYTLSKLCSNYTSLPYFNIDTCEGNNKVSCNLQTCGPNEVCQVQNGIKTCVPKVTSTTSTTTTPLTTTTTTATSPSSLPGASSTPATTTTSTTPKSSAPPTLPPGSCEVNGDPHYYTFDNQVHHFMGTCTYTLSKLCEVDGQLAEFNVEAANEHRGGNTRVSYVKYVNVDVHGYRITLEKNKEVKVDGNVVILPATLKPDVNIFLSGHDVVVTTAFGVSVRFDGNHRVVVKIPGEYANKVCGICGNFNGNKTDDFLNPDGELEPDSNSLGNSWQVDNDTRCTPGEAYPPGCTDDEKNVIANNSFCGIITNKDGPFKNCHSVIDPSVYLNNCIYDLCELNLDQNALCDSLQSYAQACQAHGVTIGAWRNDSFCPLKCQPNSHYEQCGTACPATCVKPGSPSNCNLPCTEGCVCDQGYILYDKKCVPSSQCGCWEDDKHHNVGSEFWTDDTCSTKCKCPSAGGSLECKPDACPPGKFCGIKDGVPDCYDLTFGNCVIYGDPHYNTFDKETHHFMGICTYTLSKLCSNYTSLPYFNIEAKNEHRGNPTVSWVQKVMVEVYDHKITIVKNEPSRVLVDGIWTNLPVILVNGSLTVKQSGRYVILETDFHLSVSYDTDHTVDVKVPTTYFNQTCGICGNLNGMRQDDFMMPNGELAQNSNQLGESWQVEDDDPLCNTVPPTPPPPCPPEKEELYSGNQFCGLLTSKDGPFKACHSVINPDRFFDSCVFDLCALGDSTLCKALEAYADACQRAAVIIAWRNSTFCLEIEGYRGEDFRSDIAIDDISLVKGYCTEATTTTTTTVVSKPTGSTVSSTTTTTSTTTTPTIIPSSTITSTPTSTTSTSTPTHGISTSSSASTTSESTSGPTSTLTSTTTTFTPVSTTASSTISTSSSPTTVVTPQATSSGSTTTTTTTTTTPFVPPESGMCKVNGDPHYYTFDKQVHHFMGTCTYTLSKLCEDDGNLTIFNVEAANEHRGSNTRVSYVKYVNVDVHGYRITLDQNRVVKVDGQKQTLPIHLDPEIDVFVSGSNVVVTTGFGLIVKFDGNHRVQVTIPGIYSGKVCGLCGNFNGNAADDFLNPDGQLEPDSTSLGNSWQVDNDTRCTPGVDIQPNCTDDEKDIITSSNFCGLITDKNGPFKDCHNVIDPLIYFNNCVYDLCEMTLNPDILCNSLEAYAEICQASGVIIKPWRNNTFCEPKCPPNSHYEHCGTACPATCVNPGASSTCNLPCSESCICDAGYILYGTKCVPENMCGCWDDDKHHAVGSEFWTDDTCSTKCKCPSPGTPECPENSHFSTCASACPATCVEPQSSENCSLPCSEGCECDSGYVISGGTCVPESHCGCFYNDTYYLEGEQFITTNCESVCTCRGGNNITCDPMSCTGDEICKVQNGLLGCYPPSTAICHIYGDPHYTTFDGTVHHFQGSCTYTVTETCANTSHSFSVITRNEHRGNPSWTAINSVNITVDGIEIFIEKNNIVHVNNAIVTLPAYVSDISITQSGHYVTVSTNFGLEVRFNGDHELFVKVNENYKEALCGLCGTYNDNRHDDFMTPEGDIVTNVNDFGNSWRVPDDGWPCDSTPPPPPVCPPNVQQEAEKKCWILRQSDGPFSPCHPHLRPHQYFESCVFDQCVTGGNDDLLCGVLESYAKACEALGIILVDWINNTICDPNRPPTTPPLTSTTPTITTSLPTTTTTRVPTAPVVPGTTVQITPERTTSSSTTTSSPGTTVSATTQSTEVTSVQSTTSTTTTISTGPTSSTTTKSTTLPPTHHPSSEATSSTTVSSPPPTAAIGSTTFKSTTTSTGTTVSLPPESTTSAFTTSSPSSTISPTSQSIEATPSVQSTTSKMTSISTATVSYTSTTIVPSTEHKTTITPSSSVGSTVSSTSASTTSPPSPTSSTTLKSTASSITTTGSTVTSTPTTSLTPFVPTHPGICEVQGKKQHCTPPSCPENSHFSTCASACPATCVEPQPPQNCSLPCSEGCECDSGYVISGGTCVPESHCGCFYNDTYYMEGEQFITTNCESVCTCRGGNNITCDPMSCTGNEICKVQDGLLGCYPPSTAICHIYGDPHYTTFDGSVHHFQGSCTYTVTETCANTSHSFSVITRNEHRGNPSWTAINSVNITVDGIEIFIEKNNIVHVNNVIVILPFFESGLNIAQSGQYVKVSTDFGLEVQFNGDHELFIRVKENYKGALCGLCGTYNDNRHDDFMTPEGNIVTNVNEFGNSWRVPDGGWPCDSTPPPPPVCSPSLQEEANNKCWVLKDSNGPFKACHPFLRPHQYFESCVFDQCVTGGNDDLLCGVLESYAKACEGLGVNLGNWINNTICEPNRPPTTPSATSASSTSPQPDTSSTELPLISTTTHSTPPTSTTTPTTTAASTITTTSTTTNPTTTTSTSTASTTTTRTTTTTTTRTTTTTAEVITTGICSASGDPHYNTFDGRVHHYMGNCSYTLTKLCDLSSSGFPYFHVYTTNEYRGSNTKVSYVQSVHVEVYNTNFTMLKNKKLNVNGKRTNVPTPPDSRLRVHLSGNYLILATDFGLQVRFDGNHYVDVSLPSTFKTHVCGLCGNFNGQSADDVLKPDGSIATNSNELGDSWIVLQDGEFCGSEDLEACSSNDQQEYGKNTVCGIINDKSGIFKDCHALVNPDNFFENCVLDMCYTQGESTSLCYAVQAYAQQCSDAGVCVEWRSDTFCPISCPARSYYRSCGTTCPSTCFNSPAVAPCKSESVEGCFCNDSYVLSGDKCVPQSECGCIDEQNNSYQLGESWFSYENCTRRCTCNNNNNITCETWQCGEREQCKVVDGVLGCHSSGIAACHISGDPHFYTFDKVMHTFMGTCTYVLVDVCDKRSIIPFTITGKTEDRGQRAATYLKEAYIDVYGIRITLQRDRRTLVGDTLIHTPWSGHLEGVSIANVGLYIVVTTDFGMIVKFDGNHHLEVVLPDSYFGKVCGMCGNFNGNKNDEYLMPNSLQASNVIEFGNSWKTADSDDKCLDDDRVDLGPPCTAAQRPSIESQCNALLSDTFKPCHQLVDPQLFIQSCVYDMCRYNGMISTLCAIFQAYADACRTHGVKIKWRSPIFCPLACPVHSKYTDCASLCPSTCNNIYAPDLCDKPTACLEGCVCDDGYVLSGDQCVPLKSCGCRDSNDNYYNVDESWITPHCTQKCECKKGNDVKCKSFSCPHGICSVNKNGKYNCKPTSYSKCTIGGDPHYRTFDDLNHHFQGKNTYMLTRTSPSTPDYMEPFAIEGKNEAMFLFSKFSLLKELRIEVYNHVISFRQNKVLVLNGVRTVPPVRPHEGINIYQKPTRIYLETDFGLSVSFDGNENAEITVPNSYQNLLQGLCGNFDGRKSNDFTSPDGRLISNVDIFGETWNVKSLKLATRVRRAAVMPLEEEDIVLDTGDNYACSGEGLTYVNSSTFCGVMREPNGPFRYCNQIVSPDTFIQDCIFDTCAEFQSKELLCINLQLYAYACQQNGTNVDGWRAYTGCALTCGTNSVYKNCTSACPASCSNMASESECEAPCNEGCQCEPGYILSGYDCVPYKDCGCTYLNKYYKIGDTFVTDDCSQNCTCTDSSSVVCENMQCKEWEACTTANQIRGCYIPSPCLENPCENGGTCVELDSGTDNTTSGMSCICPSSHKGPYCEEENEINNTAIYIVIGVVLGVFVISFVFIVAAYCFLKSKKKKSGILESSDSGENGRDNSNFGSIFVSYTEPEDRLNMASNEYLRQETDNKREDGKTQEESDNTVGQVNLAYNGNINDSDKTENIDMMAINKDLRARVNLAFEDDRHINESDDLTIF
ncbi:IgGFc-binding protein-like [Pyxicephalus adspersus]|uniref:IgGFc-binding protein-like n=1 Tax=Pyxicephalus adspersus TaxID=30357 RepID=UPI003B5A576A